MKFVVDFTNEILVIIWISREITTFIQKVSLAGLNLDFDTTIKLAMGPSLYSEEKKINKFQAVQKLQGVC